MIELLLLICVCVVVIAVLSELAQEGKELLKYIFMSSAERKRKERIEEWQRENSWFNSSDLS